MKTKLFLSAILFAFSMQIFAQDVAVVSSDNSSSYTSYKKPKKPKFWIGPKFGTTFHNISDMLGSAPGDNSFSKQLSESWQAGMLAQYGRTIYIQPELYYCQIESSANLPGSSSASRLQVPVMLGLRFLNLGLFSLHIMGGPEWYVPLKNTEKEQHWLAGAGIDILGFISADVRYRINSNSINEQISDFSLKTTPLNVTVGLKFR